MHPALLPTFQLTEQITDILVAAGIDAKVCVPDEDKEIPSWLGVFVTDANEPKAVWEFSPSDTEGDRYGWAYQIGTYVGDEYEGVVYETLDKNLAHNAPARDVAYEILKVLAVGIAPKDLAKIVAAYDGMMEEAVS